jgi:hypothetical protein
LNYEQEARLGQIEITQGVENVFDVQEMARQITAGFNDTMSNLTSQAAYGCLEYTTPFNFQKVNITNENETISLEFGQTISICQGINSGSIILPAPTLAVEGFVVSRNMRSTHNFKMTSYLQNQIRLGLPLENFVIMGSEINIAMGPSNSVDMGNELLLSPQIKVINKQFIGHRGLVFQQELFDELENNNF